MRARSARTSSRRKQRGKLHRPLDRLLYLGESSACVLGRYHGGKGSRLFLREVTDGIQRIDSQIHQRSSSAERSLEPPCSLRLLIHKAPVKRLNVADFARLGDFE